MGPEPRASGKLAIGGSLAAISRAAALLASGARPAASTTGAADVAFPASNVT
jgi:hypothetical protein